MSWTPFSCACPQLPPISASGFDAAAVALNFYLTIEAEAAEEFSIHAIGA